ncbi:MAG: KH domain-containing protein [Clostridia bacterium]|nr:KH domain-containing protein [Clostridia bacterium]MCR5695168.1 KH domain-containing protein [Clostridia bacterium]
MKEFLETIAKMLVDNKDAVRVTEEETEDGIYLRLSVAEEETGRVIGKDGRIAKAIRTIIRSGAKSRGKQVYVDIE